MLSSISWWWFLFNLARPGWQIEELLYIRTVIPHLFLIRPQIMLILQKLGKRKALLIIEVNERIKHHPPILTQRLEHLIRIIIQPPPILLELLMVFRHLPLQILGILILF